MGYIGHFLASVWVYIGRVLESQGKGWIKTLQDDGTLSKGYYSSYIAAIFYVFTTLSTVGYGDIVGYEEIEYLF